MEHVAEQQDSGGITVNRILSLSPEQNELMRRNHSRIYVSSKNYSIIDSLLFKSSRSILDYIPAIGRAIAEAGLKVNGDLQLRPVFDSKFGCGIFQQHVITNGWLQDDDGEAYDLFVEFDTINEEAELPEMQTYDAVDLDGVDFENPLCFKVGIEALAPQWTQSSEDEPEQAKTTDEPEIQPKHEPEVGQRGRVANPETDRRLKQNRPDQLVSARQSQSEESDGSTQRMAGRPGRVRFPQLDGRLKRNRQPAMEGAGGR